MEGDNRNQSETVTCETPCTCQANVQGKLKRGWHWFRQEIGAPVLGFLCITLGVFSSMWLPLAVFSILTPTLAPAMLISSLQLSPIAVFAIAGIVHRNGGSEEWRKKGGTVGDRMLKQYGIGVMWPVHIRRHPSRRARGKP